MSQYLPLEVVEHILTYLSAKELSSVATIRQSWNQLVTRLLYRNVDIYTVAQYHHFIKGLKECDRKNLSTMDNKNGYQVRRLCLHTVNIMLDNSEINTLKKLCPMINEFDYGPGVPITEEHLCYFTPGWKQLTRLPSWHEDKPKKWIPGLSGQITHIYCFIEELAFLPSFIKSTPLFPRLMELKLTLDSNGPPISLSWMEMLSDQCPSLTTLDMEFRDYDLGSGLKANWKPAPKLQKLAWRMDGLRDPIWYTYLSQKYPNVRELELQLGVDGYFDEFPGHNDQELNERMRVIHSDCIFNMVTNYQQLSSLKILLESKQPSYLDWYPLNELSSWLGTPAAKNIKNLYWRTDPYQLGMAGSRTYSYENVGSGSGQRTVVDVNKLNPLGNIKLLDELAFDVHTQLPECVTNICNGALELENLTSLELFFSRKYRDIETWEHLDMNAILDGCPHLKTLGLAGVNSALKGATTALQQKKQKRDPQQQHQRHWKLTHFRLHHAIINDDDYLSNILKRCPNVNKLKLYDCRIHQQRILHQQQPQPTIKAYTIDIPDHSLSLVDIRGLRLMTSVDGREGDMFYTFEIAQQNGRKTFSKYNHKFSNMNDGDNNYMVELDCRYADTIVFDLRTLLGDNLYHDY